MNQEKYLMIKSKIENNEYVSEKELDFYNQFENTSNSNKKRSLNQTVSFRPNEDIAVKMDYINSVLNLKNNNSQIAKQSIENFYAILKNKEITSDESQDLTYLESAVKETSKQVLLNQYMLSIIIDYLNVPSDKLQISSLLDLEVNPYQKKSIDIMRILKLQVEQDYKTLLVRKSTRKYKGKRR